MTHQSVHKHLALGGRGLGLQPQRGPQSGCLFKVDFVLSFVWPDKHQCPGGVAGAGK